MDFHKIFGVILFLLLNLNKIIMGQQQQQQPSPFGNIFSFPSFTFPFPSFFDQSSPNNNNPSPNAPYTFQQFFGNPNPSGNNFNQQPSNPATNNYYQGFSTWPFGGNNNNNGGGLFINPFQNLFGNNFQQSPNNQYANNNNQQQQQNNQQNPSQSQPSQNQNNNNYQYPFGFPFANPFFPQYNNQQNQQNQYQAPNTNNQQQQAPSSIGNPPSPNIIVPSNSRPLPNQGGIISPSTGGINQNNKISPGDNTNNVQPVELEVVHSKQDTKHPSLVLATPSPSGEQQQGPVLENMNIEEFPLNPDQQDLPPEIVDVRFEEAGGKGKSNKVTPPVDALMFE